MGGSGSVINKKGEEVQAEANEPFTEERKATDNQNQPLLAPAQAPEPAIAPEPVLVPEPAPADAAAVAANEVREESEDEAELCAAMTSFSLDRMTKLARKCAADPSNIPTDPFCALLDSIVLLL